MDSLIFLTKLCPPSLLFGSFVGWWGELCYCYDDVCGKNPSDLALKRSVGSMVYKPTSKVIAPSKPYWSPPKDKDPMVNKSGAIYWFQCGDLICNDECIGETSRTFGKRFKEHLKDSFCIHHHSSNTAHPTTQQNFQNNREGGHSLARNIKESIFIRVNNPTLNKNIGKFNLPYIWDRVLLNTPSLTLKRHAPVLGHANSNNPTSPAF